MNPSSQHGKRKWIILKVDLPAILAFFLFVGLIFFYLIPGFENAMMERKRTLIHEITSSAYSLLEHYYLLEETGMLSTDEARDQARSAINSIRYGDSLKDYFWITDMHPYMIDHPYRQDLVGQDLTDFRDSQGKQVFVDFVKAVSATGESYVDYMWQWNDDSTRIVPKLSYVRLFKPWGWIIGTGIYVEDVKTEIRRLEIRALIISGIFATVIIILLAVASLQSHKIEARRKMAEDELLKSKELYRTLAEAASEGVIIWSRNGLQGNKVLLSWLQYSEEELLPLAIERVFRTPEIAEYADPEILYEDLDATRHCPECILKTKNGNLLRMHADLSRIEMGEQKAVLMVIRQIGSTYKHSDFTIQEILMHGIATGFFKTTYGRKNKFTFASGTVISMLGFNSFQELQPYTIGSFFVNPSDFRVFRSVLTGKDSIYNKKVLLRRKDQSTFWAMVNVMVVESDLHDIWCEGTIELVAAHAMDHHPPFTDLSRYSAAYIMQVPVLHIMRNVVECPENMTIEKAMTMLKEINCRSSVVVNRNGDAIGIFDIFTAGIQLAEGQSPESEIFRCMISPPDYIPPDVLTGKAFEQMRNSIAKCLLVSDNHKNVLGMITPNELTNAFSLAPEMLRADIKKASSVPALTKIFNDAGRITASLLIGGGDPYGTTLFISAMADDICQKVVAHCAERNGEPPCNFAFIQMGSAGRKEQTLSTDQDNAIIFENCSGEKRKQAEAYFHTLGDQVNQMLAEIGFKKCRGGNMAGNPKWCQPLDTWKSYFTDWIKMPGPEELLSISIFFDFRFCYGNRELTDELRAFILRDLKTNDIFFHYMTLAWNQFTPSARILSDDMLDIKKILMPLTGITRLYALKHAVSGYSTIERILELHSENHIDHRLLNKVVNAWKNLTHMRLSHQIICIQKDKDPDNTVDLRISDANMLSFAEQAVEAVNELLLKAGSDFYVTSL